MLEQGVAKDWVVQGAVRGRIAMMEWEAMPWTLTAEVELVALQALSDHEAEDGVCGKDEDTALIYPRSLGGISITGGTSLPHRSEPSSQKGEDRRQ